MYRVKRTTNKLIRFDSVAQIEKIERAAKIKKWNFTRFVIEAAMEAANHVTANPVSEPLMVKRDHLPLNQ